MPCFADTIFDGGVRARQKALVLFRTFAVVKPDYCSDNYTSDTMLLTGRDSSTVFMCMCVWGVCVCTHELWRQFESLWRAEHLERVGGGDALSLPSQVLQPVPEGSKG